MKLARSVVVTFASLCLLLLLAGGKAAIASAPATSALEAAAKAYLGQDALASSWTITSQSLTQTSLSTTAGTITVQYAATENTLLNFTSPGDVPIMRGMMAEAGQLTNLSQAQRMAINSYIGQWRSNLQSYITTASPVNETLQVTATIDSAGSVNPASIQVFGLGNANGTWVPAATALSDIPSPSAQEANGRQIIASIALSQPTSPAAVSPLSWYNAWNATAAVNYANQYTSNPPNNACGTGVPEDTSKWNLSQYPYYSNCNDCADFVSQIMNAGNIPMTSAWQPGPSESGAWYNVSQLTNYMTGHSPSYWVSTSKWGVVPGSVVVAPDHSHTELVVYNSGSKLEFDAHTADVWNLAYLGNADPWPGTYSYNVQDWIRY